MSRLKLFGFAGFIMATLMSFGIATAGPVAPINGAEQLIDTDATNPLLVPVKGCHSNKKWHMVYKWGKKAMHRHKNNCQPVHTWKKKKNWKKKSWQGNNWQGNQGKWCHKSFKKHWHKYHGSQWHRHAGNGCHWSKGKKYNSYKKGCFKLGPVWVCP